MPVVKMTVGEAVRAVELTGRATEFYPGLGYGVVPIAAADDLYKDCLPHILAVIVGVEGVRPSEAWDGDEPTSMIFARIRDALGEAGCPVRSERPVRSKGSARSARVKAASPNDQRLMPVE